MSPLGAMATEAPRPASLAWSTTWAISGPPAATGMLGGLFAGAQADAATAAPKRAAATFKARIERVRDKAALILPSLPLLTANPRSCRGAHPPSLLGLDPQEVAEERPRVRGRMTGHI